MIEIPVHEAAVVADGGDEMRAVAGAVELKGDGLFDAGGEDAPVRGLGTIDGGEVEGFPASVAGRKDGVIRIGGIDFDIEKPVDGRGLHVRREGVVVDAAMYPAKDRPPGRAGIGGPENVLAAFGPG